MDRAPARGWSHSEARTSRVSSLYVATAKIFISPFRPKGAGGMYSGRSHSPQGGPTFASLPVPYPGVLPGSRGREVPYPGQPHSGKLYWANSVPSEKITTPNRTAPARSGPMPSFVYAPSPVF